MSAVQHGRLELRLPCQDGALEDARTSFVDSLRTELQAAFCGGSLSAAAISPLNAVQQAVVSTTEEVLVAEGSCTGARTEVSQLCDGQGLLLPCPQVPSCMVPPACRNGMHFAGGSVVAAPRQPLTGIAVSASGHYVALSGDDEVLLLETCTLGFRIAATRSVEPGKAIAAVCFFDETTDNATLLLAAGELCIGWEALKAHDSGVAHFPCPGSSTVPEEESFLSIHAVSGSIVALALSRNASTWVPGEFLLLGTDAGTFEVYDLHLNEPVQPPALLHAVHVGGSLVAAALAADGDLAFAAAIHVPGGPAVLYAYEVSTGRYAAALQPSGKSGEGLRLAHNAMEALLAVGSADGLVEVYSTLSLGPTAAKADTSAQVSGGADGDGASTVPPGVALAWCGDRPVLAVGACGGAILVYRYQASEGLLEPTAILNALGGGSPPRSLAWAPGLGVLLAAWEAQWRLWLLVVQGSEEREGLRVPAPAREEVPTTARLDPPANTAAAWLERLEHEVHGRLEVRDPGPEGSVDPAAEAAFDPVASLFHEDSDDEEVSSLQTSEAWRRWEGMAGTTALKAPLGSGSTATSSWWQGAIDRPAEERQLQSPQV